MRTSAIIDEKIRTMTDSIDLTEGAGYTGQDADNAPRTAGAGISKDTSLRFISTNSEIDVRLSNQDPISALRFEVVFDRKFGYKAPELGTRVQNLNSYINFQDNVVTFVFLDIDGKGIAPGVGTVIKIPRDSEQGFDITAAYASTRASGIQEIGYTISNDLGNEESLILEQNDPNPFSGRTKLEFSIPNETDTKLMIYDVGGALIRTLVDSKMTAGEHSVEWDGCDDSGRPVDSGIYLYKLYAGVYSVTRKMVFLTEGTPDN